VRICQYLTPFLRNALNTCFAASNCLSALKFAAFSRPDLFLLNTHLPDGDGIALYDCLHAKKCLAAVPAVILSTQLPYYQSEIDARQLVACEMPFELGSLLGTVDNVLSQGSQNADVSGTWSVAPSVK
jgi:DNA-binding response OmpR family regulator